MKMRIKKRIAAACAAVLFVMTLTPTMTAAEGRDALSAVAEEQTKSDAKMTAKNVEVLAGFGDEVSSTESKKLWFTPDYESVPFVDTDFMLERRSRRSW